MSAYSLHRRLEKNRVESQFAESVMKNDSEAEMESILALTQVTLFFWLD